MSGHEAFAFLVGRKAVASTAMGAARGPAKGERKFFGLGEVKTFVSLMDDSPVLECSKSATIEAA